MRPLAPDAEMRRRATVTTLENRPTVFVFIPPSLATVVEMAIFDEHDALLYEATFSLPRQTGIIGFPWPDTAPGLEIGRSYLWSVALVCDPMDRSSDLLAGGWIQRQSLPPSLASTLEAIPPDDRPRFLAEQGVWHDALSSLIQLRLADPQNQHLQDDWNSLLNSIDLQSITQEPIFWFEYIPFNPLDTP